MIYIISLFFAELLTLLYIGVKNKHTLYVRFEVIDAIRDFGIDTQDFVEALRILGSQESYTETLFRLWDWGYTRILPEKEYEIIKPYLQKGKKK